MYTLCSHTPRVWRSRFDFVQRFSKDLPDQERRGLFAGGFGNEICFVSAVTEFYTFPVAYIVEGLGCDVETCVRTEVMMVVSFYLLTPYPPLILSFVVQTAVGIARVALVVICWVDDDGR